MLQKYEMQLFIAVLLLHVASFSCVAGNDIADLARKAEAGDANAPNCSFRRPMKKAMA